MGDVVSICEKVLDDAVERNRPLMLALKATAQMERISFLSRDSYRMLPQQSEEYQNACSVYCQALTSLIRDFVPEKAYFNFTPKSHIILHLADCSKYIHPRLGSCYAGEELMAIVRRLIQGVNRARKPISASNNALERWLHAMSYKLAPGAMQWRRK